MTTPAPLDRPLRTAAIDAAVSALADSDWGSLIAEPELTRLVTTALDAADAALADLDDTALLDHLADAEGHEVALTMLHRFKQGWRIDISDGVWWWLRRAVCANDDSTPPMQLADDEIELWTALRTPSGAMVRQRKDRP